MEATSGPGLTQKLRSKGNSNTNLELGERPKTNINFSASSNNNNITICKGNTTFKIDTDLQHEGKLQLQCMSCAANDTRAT